MTKNDVEKIVEKFLKNFEVSLDASDVEHTVREVLDKLINPRFDIHLSDAHCDGDPYTTIPQTENLTVEDVGRFVLSGGDWNFQIVPHRKSPEVEGMVLASGGTSHSDHNIAY